METPTLAPKNDLNVTRRLRRLIFGPDGTALVVSELIQRLLQNEWPPEKSTIATSTSVSHIQPPYLSINQDATKLIIVLPQVKFRDIAIRQLHMMENKLGLRSVIPIEIISHSTNNMSG